MKIIKFVKAFFAAVTLITASVGPVFAQTVKIVGPVTYNGSGCPIGTLRPPVVSPNGKELSVLFDQFTAIGNGSAINKYKTCNLIIPLRVPAGFQVTFFNVDYRGYISPATTGRLRAEYFFAGARGPVFSQTLVGETDYFVRHDFSALTGLWSGCGQAVNLRVNASIRANGRGIATVGSSNLAGRRRGIVFPLVYRTCV